MKLSESCCARSSTGQSNGLLSRGLRVRVLPGTPTLEEVMVRLVEKGEAFLEGEVWTSPRGTKYRVLDSARKWGASPIHYVTLETLPEFSRNGRATRRKRQWDAVDGWVRVPEDN